jgi:dihydroorotase
MIFNMDVLIEDRHVIEVAINIDDDQCDVIDATDCYILPGLIDMHCELCEPGYDFRESFETAGNAAIAGGFTALTCNPMTDPIIDNKTVVEYVVNKGVNVCPVSVHPYGALTKGNQGEEVTEIGEMQLRGIVAVSDGDISMQDSRTIKTVFQYASMFDMPIILHCEDTMLSKGYGVNDGYIATQLGLLGSMAAAETIMVAKYIAIAEELDVRIHLTHISTKGSVELIRAAKERGVRITSETSPQYFSLTEECVLDYNTYAKVNPPLRCEDDIKAIIKGLKDGVIDVISSDHQPHNIDSKAIEFSLASNGISALETAFSSTYTYLVEPGHLTMEEVIDKMSYKPSDLLTINKSRFGVGQIADLFIFDPKADYTVDARKFKSKAKHSPYHGMTLKGVIKYTFVEGKKYTLNL